jgi:hypothetical protein
MYICACIYIYIYTHIYRYERYNAARSIMGGVMYLVDNVHGSGMPKGEMGVSFSGKETGKSTQLADGLKLSPSSPVVE